MALVDGDILLHRALRGTEVQFDGEPVANLEEAKRVFHDTLVEWVEAAGAEDFWLCISDDKNFRKTVARSYKAGRGPKPPGFEELKEWVGQEYEGVALRFPNIEADDLIGILLTDTPNNRIAVSIDKDMRTIPGLHYNPQTKQTFRIEEEEANLTWMRQTLTGDAIDGYSGVPKIGPARAAKLLHTPAPLPVLWRVTLDVYEKAELDPKYAVATARLAYILRNGDYDKSTGEVLWTEPEPCGREDLPPEYRSNVQGGGASAPARRGRKAQRSRNRPRED